jgi:hypothetical protein
MSFNVSKYIDRSASYEKNGTSPDFLEDGALIIERL